MRKISYLLATAAGLAFTILSLKLEEGEEENNDKQISE